MKVWKNNLSKNINPLDQFVKDFGEIEEEISISKNNTIKDEVLNYETLCKNFKGTFSEFWTTNQKNFPKLTSLVMKISIIQASSVPSESTFSVSGYVQRKERHSLSSRNLKFTMLAREITQVKKILEIYNK